LLALLAPLASAATIIVTTNSDAASGVGTAANCPGANCSLRDAIAKAAAGDTINFASSISTIALAGYEMTVDKNLSIDASAITGGVTIDGTLAAQNSSRRVFQVSGTLGTPSTVNFNNLTIKNGAGGIGQGSYTTLTLTNCTVTGNDAGSFRTGGGIASSSQSDLTLINSIVSNNKAGDYGAGISSNGASLTLINSTVSGNTITTTGGWAGGIFSSNTVTLTNSTVSGNTGYFGGGIDMDGGTLTISNSTITGNTDPGGEGDGIELWNGATATLINTTLVGNGSVDLYNSSSHSGTDPKLVQLTNTLIGACDDTTGGLGEIADNGGNLDGGTQCGFPAARSSISFGLGALANNGGPTQTMKPLLATSAPVGKGVLAACTAAPISGADQRGYVRGTAACDSGAVEYAGTEPTYKLTLTVTGAGGGSVTDTLTPTHEINACDSTTSPCVGNYPNGPVTLVASPTAGYSVTWSGACVPDSANPLQATATMNGTALACTAAFTPPQPYTLSVTVAGPSGAGSVSDDLSPHVIDTCTVAGGANCSGSTSGNASNQVTLTASANAGYSFSGWSGADCSGSASTATLTMTADRSCTATFARTPHTLTVTVAGPGGAGSVSDDLSPHVIDTCTVAGGANCSGSTSGNASNQVTLTASANAGYSFSGWSGADCSGSANTATLTMDADRACTATFALITHTLTVTVTNAGGSGSVTDNQTPPVIDACTATGGTCSGSAGGAVTLTAAPDAGSAFGGWGGDCASAATALTATVTMDQARTCSAQFITPPPVTIALTITVNGGSGGSVSAPPQITNCTSTCSGNYAPGSSVTLVASPASGYAFAGWGGACAGASPTVTVTVNAATTCTAGFSALGPPAPGSTTGVPMLDRWALLVLAVLLGWTALLVRRKV
jgi:hypothetical protein